MPVPEISDWLSARGNSRTELTNYLYDFGTTSMWMRSPGLSLVIELRYGAVRRVRAAFAKVDMRHGNIRRHCFPRKVANDVARIASSLPRLEPPTCAPKRHLVLGPPVRPTTPDSWRTR